ncbi:elongin A, like [Chanos chanos]|uniref:Elongin A, like n=1 Tax=Chanos chanos TaxID=29144 RepID=A0A6J2VA92_CHACN|nr:elongin-A-like [Chanos chanos]
MAAADVKKVLRLKHQLEASSEAEAVLKTLKKLKELDITLDILAETGIGKVVNSFRKHADAGELAKTLVSQWKKLVPKDNTSSGCKPSKLTCSESRDDSKGKSKEPVEIYRKSQSKSCQSLGKLQEPSKFSHSSDFKKTVQDTANSQVTQEKVQRLSMQGKETIEKPSEADPVPCLSKDKESKKTKEKLAEIDEHKKSEGPEKPSMSFEAYLSYDLEAPKRKKQSCDGKKAKRFKMDRKADAQVQAPGVKSNTRLIQDPPNNMVVQSSFMELLSIPLPATLPECDDLAQFSYFERKTEEKVFEEPPVFTGQRLNRKMQVYSGTKISYLPKMLTLYQQCIRALQNNIDSLYEIGGVPFEIVEPVLERCTPEQLLRIEECNPVYIGETDHLWEKHCKRDFRNGQLQEYESWREMHVRLSEERERKLRRLTKSIVSAQSGKPKGRQVKLAFIHSAAKPPRNVRIQQEIHGTAGPTIQPHPLDKARGQENRGRPCFSEPTRSTVTSASSSQAQDPRKIKRVAPMMAKSLKAFKKQLGRR